MVISVLPIRCSLVGKANKGSTTPVGLFIDLKVNPSNQYAEFKSEVTQLNEGCSKGIDSLAEMSLDGSPCVYLRYASVSWLFLDIIEENIHRVAYITLTFCFDKQFLIVVGDPVGLERELKKQIIEVGVLAGLDPDFVHKILKKMTEHGKNRWSHVNEKNFKVFTLLLSPTVAQLSSVISDNVCRELDIIYTGHAGVDGLWVFSDDDFGHTEIFQCLHSLKF